MTTHIMSFTYEPKVQAVLSGKCRQTIRKKRDNREILPGDFILFHGWEGYPYRSKWSWRMKVKVKRVGIAYLEECCLQPIGGQFSFVIFRMNVKSHPWNSEFATKLAERDGIVPPNGRELKEVLKKLNGPEWEGYYDVIEFERVEEEKKK